LTLYPGLGSLPDIETLVQTGSHERVGTYLLKSDFLSIINQQLATSDQQRPTSLKNSFYL